MAISRAERRSERIDRVRDAFGDERYAAVLDLLELVEFAWHDCYDEVTPNEQVIDDILDVSRGEYEALIGAALLAVVDYRDLRLAGDAARAEREPRS